MAWKYALVLLVAIVVAHIEAKKGTATKTLANTACIDDLQVLCIAALEAVVHRVPF